MLEKTQAQYDALTGTEWEEAARINLAFFAVGTRLQDPSAALPEAAAELAQQELDLVYAAAINEVSPLTQDYVDYTQFQPRGYYEGDAVLEAYFRAMMWYGQLNFFQKTDVLNRSALLMILAMAQDLEAWETIYTVTSCFAGTSDDLGYYEYAPAIEAAYGSLPQAADLPENEAAYETYVGLIEAMDPPAINSVPSGSGIRRTFRNIPRASALWASGSPSTRRSYSSWSTATSPRIPRASSGCCPTCWTSPRPWARIWPWSW